MKLTALLHRRLHWINLPGAVLMMLLQRAPVVSAVAIADEMVISSPVGSVLRSLVAAVAALGAMNTLVGASPLVVSAGTSTGITVPTGSPMSVSFSLPGSDNRADPTAMWTLGIATGSSFPPGLSFSGLTGPGTAMVKFPQLSGTPTAAGTYHLTLEALSADSAFSALYNYTVTVTATNTAPSFGTQPSDQTVTAGASAMFTAAASGTPAPTLQWQRAPSGGSTFANLSEGGGYTGTTTGTLTVSGTTVGMSGDHFRCVATNSVSAANSNSVLLTVNPAPVAPSFGTQPVDKAVTAGASASFTAAASGTPTPTLRWQRAPFATGIFANLSDGGSYAGTATGTLTVSGTTVGMSGDHFRCVATNSVSSTNSNSVLLTVNAAAVAPSFGTQPVDQVVIAGAPASFTAAASGTPTPTLQWQRAPFATGIFANLSEGGSYAGTTTGTLTVSGTTVGMSGDHFRCVATNTASAVNSTSVLLTVNAAITAPAFTLQPAGQSILIGHPVTFMVTATGNPAPTLQWKKNNVDIGGATGTSYTIASVTQADAGTYSVVATNSVTSTASNPAALTVLIHIADFNGDGQSDLVWQNTLTGERDIWAMNGTTFASGAFLGLLPTDWSIAGVADFNGDGWPDLLWQNTITGERAIWLMNGTTFVSGVGLGIVPTEWSIAGAGDFSADGKPDIVFQNTVTGERSLWVMNGTSFVSGFSLGMVPLEWSITAVVDFDGDGKTDLLLTNTRTGEVTIWLMSGTNVTNNVSLGLMPPQWQVAGAGDYNADGKPDILVTNTLTGERAVWLMNGTSITGTAAIATIPLEWVLNRPVVRHVPVDFNADANSDLVWQNTVTGERAIWLMDGTAFWSGVSLGVVPTDWSIAAFADFNFDGKTDILWQNMVTGERVIWLMDGTAFLSGVSLGMVPTDWSIAGTGDFSGDGKPDIVFQNTSTGERSVWVMDGTNLIVAVTMVTIPTDWWIAAIGDFNGDGKPDLVWQNTATGERAIWLMNGTNFVSGAGLGVIPTDWWIVGSGDFNADGMADLVWQNTTTGERAIWLMNGTTFMGGAGLGVHPVQWSIRN